MNNLKTWAVISLVINIIWNYAVYNGWGGILIFLGMVAYFFSLYMITKIRGLNPWLAGLGILNIFGLLVVLFASKDMWGKKPR